MKKIIAFMLLSFLFSVVVLAVLIAMSGLIKKTNNSFLRILPPHPAIEGDTIVLPYNTYYIAGGTPHTVYLGNSVAPLHLLQIDLTTLDTQRVSLKIAGIRERKFWSPRIQVDSPLYYLTDGAVPVIYRGNVHDWRAEEFFIDSIFFRSIVPVDGHSLLIKSLSGTNENILGKLTESSPYHVFHPDVLERQIDGIFCTDGMIHYNKESGQSVYLYYYRNGFIVMDSSFQVQYRGKTIDTTSRALIKPVVVEGVATLGSPPHIVNYASDMNSDFLFVHSRSLARNELPDAFDHGRVIDVYDLSNGLYRLSFYIWHHGYKKMIQFRVFENTVVVLYDQLIRLYKLEPRYFDKTKPM